MTEQRERWGSKLGIILAVAGSAVGLGNFLRFPGLVAKYGGGAFLIPYFIAFLLLGIPLMWVEWTLGRMGGELGHGSAPGIFDAVTRKRMMKYLGIIGIMVSFSVLAFYIYVEAWSMGYAFFSLTGKFAGVGTADPAAYNVFLQEFQGVTDVPKYFVGGMSGIMYAFIFFCITFAINFFFIYRGLQGGIEKIVKIAMPMLIGIGVIMAVFVAFMGTPERSIAKAYDFLWQPKFESLSNPKVWIEAAGQIFFTLSVGMGIVLTYASYLKKKDDVVLSGLTASSMNEFCEVVLGAAIIIPAAFIFLGPDGAQATAKAGTFGVGFVTSPLIFQNINPPMLGQVMGFLWFLLLFLAGITSSVSLIQPSMSFLEDEFKVTRKKATAILFIVFFLACQPTIWFYKHGVIDVFDFWGCTMLTVLLATIEVIIFGWMVGMEKGWENLTAGAKIKPPIVFKYIIKYVTPLYLFIITGWFGYQQIKDEFFTEGKSIPSEDLPYIWMARGVLILAALILGVLIHIAWKNKKNTEVAK